MVTEGRTLLIITQVSSGLENHIIYKYLHVKIASLAIVKSCVTVVINGKRLALYSLSVLPLRLSTLTEESILQ